MAIDAAKLMSLMKAKKQSMKKIEKTIKPVDGNNDFVLLQGWRKGEEQVYFHDYGQHFVKNEADELQAVYLCADKTFGTACPVCAAIGAGIRGATDDDTVNLLKKANATQRYLVNVLALNTSEPDTPQILELSATAFAQLVTTVEAWGVALLDDVEPQIVTVNRSGKGLLTKYVVGVSPKKHAMPKGVLSKLNNLDEYVAQESEEGKRKAISAVANMSGILAAPSIADRPRLAAAKLAEFEADDADLASLSDKPVTPTVVKAKVAKPAADDFAFDEEMEALLAAAK